MTFPLVFGARSSDHPELRQSFPVNLQVQLMDVGATKLYLAPIEGVVAYATLPGRFRGYIVWQDKLVVVTGTTVSLYINGAFQNIGTIPDDGNEVKFAQSFERLAILTGGAVYYVKQSTTYVVVAPTDPSLASGVTAIAWVGGYFILTDGKYLYSTVITDPDTVVPSDSLQIQTDSSAILGLLVIRSELYVIMRNSIQLLQNTAATGFPFSVVQSAMIAKGALNARAFTFFMDVIAFIGGAANEAPALYIYIQGQLQKLSGQEIDLTLSALTADAQDNLWMEACIFNSKGNLYIHMNNECFVYDHIGSQQAGVELWHKRVDSLNELEPVDYSCSHFLRFNGVTLCIQNNAIKTLSLTPYLTPAGKRPYWTFSTPIIYSTAQAFVIHKEELTVLPGRDTTMSEGTIGVQSSQDGVNWSELVKVKTGRLGETLKNIVWLRRGFVRNWRIEKFVGVNAPYLSFLLLECDVEALAL